MTPESRAVYLICNFLKLKGFTFWINPSMGTFDQKRGRYLAHNNPYKIKGVPDILGILPGGRFLGIEVKKPKVVTPNGQVLQQVGRVSPEQKAFIENAKALGAKVFVASSIEEVKRELEIA